MTGVAIFATLVLQMFDSSIASAGPDPTGEWLSPLQGSRSGHHWQMRSEWEGDEVEIDLLVNHRNPAAGEASWWRVLYEWRILDEEPTLQGGWRIDLEVQQVTQTPLSEDVARDYNRRARCGFTNWRHGRAMDVTGRDCEGSDQMDDGEVVYQVIRIRDGWLSLGSCDRDRNVCTSPRRRPRLWDETSSMRRRG